MVKDDIFWTFTKNITIDTHYYHFFKVIASADNKFDCTINGIELSQVSGLVLNKNVPHSIHAPQTGIFTYFLEIDNAQSGFIKHLLQGKPWLDISARVPGYLYRGNRQSDQEDRNLQKEANDLILNILPKNYDTIAPLDSRVISILDYVDQNIQKQKKLSLKQIAGHIFLSPERTRHLFEEQTGVPFSQYILWKRLKKSIHTALSHQLPLGEVAVQNGFSDQSHFNKIFKRMFGVTPRYMLTNSFHTNHYHATRFRA